MPDDIILSTTGLGRDFKGFTAVGDVDLQVRRGSIHALIGPNGAGKTTCFNLLTKFLQPSRGSIVYKGRDITRMQPADVARLGLVRSFQISAVFGAHDGAGERAHRAAAPQARRQLRLLALRARAALAERRGARPDRGRGAHATSRHAGGRAPLRPQARPGDRDHARARARDAAARRAHGRHGPRGRRAHRRPHPPRLAEPHDPDGRAQPLGRRLALRPHHRAGARQRAGGGRLRRPSPRIPA